MITPSEFELYIVRKVARNPQLINETHDSVRLDHSYNRSVTEDQKEILASLHTDSATCTCEYCRSTEHVTDKKTNGTNESIDDDDDNYKIEKREDEEHDSLSSSSSSSSSVFLEPTFVPSVSSQYHQTSSVANTFTNKKSEETSSTLQFGSVAFNTLLQRAIVDNAIAPVGGVHIFYELLWAPYVRALKIAKQIYNLKKEMHTASSSAATNSDSSSTITKSNKDINSARQSDTTKQVNNVRSVEHMRQELINLERECDRAVKELKNNMVNIKVRLGALKRIRNIQTDQLEKEQEYMQEEHLLKIEESNHKDAHVIGDGVRNSAANAVYKRERSGEIEKVEQFRVPI